MKKRYVKASMTIEMTYMIPLLMMILIFSIRGTFYFHDKNILLSTAYETAAIISTKMREEQEVTDDEAIRIYEDRIKGKCVIFIEPVVSVAINKEQVIVCATETKQGMTVSVEASASITEPEDTVRKVQIIRKQVTKYE